MKTNIIGLIMLALLVLGFQNCTGVSFSTGTDNAGSVGIAPTHILDREDINDVNDHKKDEDNDDIADEDDDNSGTDSDDEEFEEIVNDDTPSDGGLDLDSLCQVNSAVPVETLQVGTTLDRWYKNLSGSLTISVIDKIALKNIRGNVDIEKANLLVQAKNIKGQLSAKTNATAFVHLLGSDLQLTSKYLWRATQIQGDAYLHANQFSTLKKVKGSVCALTNSGKRIKNVRGDVKLIGYTKSNQSAKVRRVKNIKGDVHLINVHVDIIKNVRGNIYLQNSTVGKFKNIQGSVVE